MFGKKRMGLYHDAVVWYKKNKNIYTLLDGKWPSGTLEKKGQLFEWCNLFVFLLPLCVVCPTARCVPCDRIMLRVHFVLTLAHSSDSEPRGYKVNVWPNNLIQKFYMGHFKSYTYFPPMFKKERSMQMSSHLFMVRNERISVYKILTSLRVFRYWVGPSWVYLTRRSNTWSSLCAVPKIWTPAIGYVP